LFISLRIQKNIRVSGRFRNASLYGSEFGIAEELIRMHMSETVLVREAEAVCMAQGDFFRLKVGQVNTSLQGICLASIVERDLKSMEIKKPSP
jgi:hypothetical protein